MKARLKGTKDPFVEITEVSLADKPYVVYDANRMEFEQQQQPTSDHWQDLRERAAIAAMQSFISYRCFTSDECALKAVAFANVLVEELKGE